MRSQQRRTSAACLGVKQGLSSLDLHTAIYYIKRPPESREASSVKWIPPDILVVIRFYHPILSETCNLILIPIYDRIKPENRIPQEKSSIIYYIDVD